MNWKIKEKREIKEFASINLHPVILGIIADRGYDTEEKINNFLYPDYAKGLFDPFLFSDMEKVLERIESAKERNEKIIIFGDYDADGVTSSAILAETLENIGLSPNVYIPDKKLEGYGMNLGAVDEFQKQNVKLIITVDCGITNQKEVEKANGCGIDCIIIDHHHIPEKLPEAYAIINPNLKNSGYPFSELAGVGVTFKVVEALYRKFLPDKLEQLKWILDIVAIGTVADCVPLVKENRVITKFGLIVLSKTKRLGLLELFKVARLRIDENNFPNARTIAFQIAPRINAAGRMDHANTAFKLIRETNEVKARDLSLELEGNNQKRQKVTGQIVDEIRVLAKNMFKDKKFIFAVSEHFSIGVVGLAAGKIAEEFNKPTAVINKGENESHGSFRSIPQVNIIEAIEKCSELLVKFGGHSQAAGITVENKNLDKFFEKLGAIIEEELKDKDVTPITEIDAEIFPKEMDFDLSQGIKKMEPFGHGNEEPVFLMKNLLVDELMRVGNGEKHLKMFLKSQDGTPKVFEAIGFNLTNGFSHLKKGDKIDVVFNICEDDWNGNKKIQLKIIDLKIVS
ncbi:MAG: single-stranded-DNA-specific exonuclease RecJ [bacterium]|nr:single-stranded-DNA-specific exonuclease RecJ [bacterium]